MNNGWKAAFGFVFFAVGFAVRPLVCVFFVVFAMISLLKKMAAGSG
jgi:hypothetical protein